MWHFFKWHILNFFFIVLISHYFSRTLLSLMEKYIVGTYNISVLCLIITPSSKYLEPGIYLRPVGLSWFMPELHLSLLIVSLSSYFWWNNLWRKKNLLNLWCQYLVVVFLRTYTYTHIYIVRLCTLIYRIKIF